MTTVKQKNVPALRFPEFTDAWEQRKLGDLANITIGEFVIKSKQKQNAPYPVYNGGTSFTGLYNEYNNEPDKIVISARGANAGFINLVRTRYWAGNSCYSISILNNNKFNLEYVYQFMKNTQYLFTAYQQAANIPSVSKKDVEVFNISAPSIIEQQKIGSFFKKLDDTIALQERKLDLLKEQKKGFLQKMFPKNGEKVPEIRFRGFTDDWEQHKLVDVAEIIAGGDIDKSKIKDVGTYPVYANALTNDGVVGYYDEDFRVEAPAVTVTGRGDIGHAQVRKVNFTPVVRLLSVKSEHDIDFLENAINNHKVLVESTGVPQLTSPQLGNYRISFPNIDEEKKIGLFFSNLNKHITLHQRKLELLKEMKKAFLQKMFV